MERFLLQEEAVIQLFDIRRLFYELRQVEVSKEETFRNLEESRQAAIDEVNKVFDNAASLMKEKADTMMSNLETLLHSIQAAIGNINSSEKELELLANKVDQESLARKDQLHILLEKFREINFDIGTASLEKPLYAHFPKVTIPPIEIVQNGRLRSVSNVVTLVQQADIHFIESDLMKQLGLSNSHVSFLADSICNRVDHILTPFQLKYMASRDGFSVDSFHRHCDNVERLLVLIRTKSGYLFGGFSVLAFDSSNTRKNDPNSFLYSLVNPHRLPPIILKPKKGGKAGPLCWPEFGPCYGTNSFSDLGLRDNADLRGGWSFVGHIHASYETTGLGANIFAGGHVDLHGATVFEPVVDIIAFQT